jgi:prepilin-type N-terminal cleavage/methylation domain-containing protein
MEKDTRRGAGFTLIELLVVIAIIGLLATIILVSLNGATGRSRDAQRASDLHTIETALELYYDANGNYPFTTTYTSFDSPTFSPNLVYTNAAHTGTGLTLSQALAPYVHGLADPSGATGQAGYLYTNTTNNGANYCILIWLTPENMNDFPQSEWRPANCTAINSAGQCDAPVGSAHNGVYYGVGTYQAGC